MHEADLDETRRRYGERWREFGYDPRTLGWNKGRQRVRFAAAIDGLNEPFDSVLDVGCGFGDLFAFLRERGWTGRYVGVDVVPELLEEGRRRFGAQGAEFVEGDFSSGAVKASADVALAIGVFNHVLGHDNAAFIRATTDAMWAATRKAVVVDFMSTAATIRYDHLHYVAPAEAVELASNYGKRFAIDHGYMPFEFQLTLWHDQEFAPEAPVYRPYVGLLP